MKIALYALTPQGAEFGRRLADQLGADLFLPASLADGYGGVSFNRIADMVAHNYASYTGHLFIAATGIIVRTLAPLISSKDRDPAVVVLDHHGKYAISLLSGHLGGANELAERVAALTGGKAVITTATDTLGLPSIDLIAKERALHILNLDGVKSINMAILRGKTIQVFDSENRLGLHGDAHNGLKIKWISECGQWESGRAGVWVHWRSKNPESGQLVLHPRCLIAGIGCNRGTSSREIRDLIRVTCSRHGLALESLWCLTSIEDKKDEAGLLKAADELDVPLFYFNRKQINTVDPPHPSGVVKKHMGVSSVCEATALLKSETGRLLIPKTKSLNATIAVALGN